MPKSVQFVAGALAVAWLTGPANGEQMPWSHDAIRNETDSPEDGQFLRRSLGLGIGKPEFDANADLNGDGVVNVLDVAVFQKARGSVHTANRARVRMLVDPTDATVPGHVAGCRMRTLRAVCHENADQTTGFSDGEGNVPSSQFR